MKQHRLLFIGGLFTEIEAVKIAREKGIYTVVADYYDADKAPAKLYADASTMTSATDVDALVEFAKENDIDSVFVGFSDLLLPYYADVCERLGVPSYGTREQFDVMANKDQFKRACVACGVPTVPEYDDVDSDSLDPALYPVIIKPVDSAGSRGISICNDSEELKRGIKHALDYSPSKKYIVERYMTGDEAVLYYYVQDGNPVFMGMCDRYTSHVQKGVAQLPLAYIYPSIHTQSHIDNADSLYKGFIRSLGIMNGPIFFQVFMDDGIPYVYEAGYRLCGAREHIIFDSVIGVGSQDMLIDFAVSGHFGTVDLEEVADPFMKGKIACKLSPLLKKGLIDHVVGMDEVLALPSVHALITNKVPGYEVKQSDLGTLFQIAYRCYIVEDTLEDMEKTINYIQSTIDFFDANGNSMLMPQFDTSLL